jgi:hypothetical protein
MVSRHFQALAAALLLGTAAVAAGAIAYPTAAEAAARPQVGKLLNQAVEMAKSGNTGGANAKLHEAEAVGGLTPGDQQAIDQVRNYISAKSGSGATGSKAKFAQDYNLGHYAAVVGADADELRKAGQYDGESQLIVAQAYYLMGNYDSAIRLLKNMGGDQAQSLLMSAASKSGDDQAEMAAAEKLISNGQTKYWTYMLTGAEGTRGLTDHQNLDILRLRLLTGMMRNAADYQTGAELSLEVGDAAGAVNFTQKGITAKVLVDARSQRLAGLAQAAAAKDVATIAQQVAAAKTGDAMVKLGEKYTGMGKYPEAIAAIQAGQAKNPTDPNDAQIRLGQAYLAAGQKDKAAHAFGAVKGDPKQELIAHLWALYTRTAK